MINAVLVGLPELISKISVIPSGVRAALVKKITQLSLDLQANIVRDKLSGQVLGVRTGDLRRSIQQRVESPSNGVFGYVFSSGDVKYAAFWEFGFHGTEQVRAHQRLTKDSDNPKGFLTVGQVKAYSRVVNQEARPFMRPAFADMSDEIRQGMIEAAKEGLRSQVMNP
jgi:HK97 gp10 family phage protein